GEARSAQLHALAESLAACTDHRDMARCAAAWLSDQLGRPCAVFIRAEGDQAMPFFAADTQAQFHEQAVRWALEHGRPLGRGCADWPDLPLWCAPFSPRGPRSPAGAVQVLLQRGDRPQGEEIDHWQALVRQVGLSVERERAADAAREAKAQADAQDTRNILLASLAHDLRTPLTGIVGSASALRAQGDAMTAAQRSHLLANLENEARDMALMADNILQMARLSQPHSQLVLQWESIEELLGTAAERMRRRWPGARITWKVPPGLPPVRVEASLMAQLVANLIDNALRHAGAQAEIVIQAGRSRGGIFIAVRDHGPGLPPQLAPADLFKPNAARHRSAAGGAGLGLTICQAIVKAHGGRIAATPCNPGLEFRVDLPVAPALEASHA
ncbi:MAG TPA: ATP-binding protein, partial [Ramlibacter sp.]|nr:ATP-binding protein [Ramlibacter sp.]